jgi:hypothetical protein
MNKMMNISLILDINWMFYHVESKLDLFKKQFALDSFEMPLNVILKKVKTQEKQRIKLNHLFLSLGYRTLVDSQVVYIHPSSSIYHRQPEWYE